MAIEEGRYFKGAMTDKRYEADGLAEYCRRFLRSGVWTLGENLRVSAAGGMKISIGFGYALVCGYPYGVVDNGTGSLQISVNPSNTNPRIDRVVIWADEVQKRVFAYIKQGLPAVSPAAPSINQQEISLARINIPAGAAAITAANVTDERADHSVCGLVNIQSAWPVGSIFMSSKETSPGELFGGVWTRINDAFPLFAGNTYGAGSTGGSAEVTLKTSNLPNHAHGINHDHGVALSSTVSNDHFHSVNLPTGFEQGYSDYGVAYLSEHGNNQGIGRGGDIAPVAFTSFDGRHHSHVINGNTNGISANHTHTVDMPNFAGTSGPAGEGVPINKLPPYKAFYAWERTA